MKRNTNNIITSIFVMGMGFILSGCGDTVLLPAQVPPSTITLKIQNYCPLAGFTHRDTFAFNASTRISGVSWTTDFDRDGLIDSLEQDGSMINQFGISANNANTINAAYSDLLIVKMGLQSSAQNLLPNCANSNSDADRDGLNDCEEGYLQTDGQKADTDGDGIPDGVEFRFGLNPKDANDIFQSIMGDNMTNLEKIKTNLPITGSVDNRIAKLGLDYSTFVATNPPAGSSNCKDIEVTNIPVVKVSNGNKIMVYVVEDKVTYTSGTAVLDRQAHWLTVIVPPFIMSHSTVVVNNGIQQQIVDGVNIPLVVIPPGGSN